MFACTFIGFISRCCSRLWLCSCFLLTILATAAAGGHYTYEIEFAGHTIFVKLAFKYLMRQAKGNAQRIAGSKIFECLVSPLFFFFWVLAKRREGQEGTTGRQAASDSNSEHWLHKWNIEGCVCVCVRRGRGKGQVTQLDLAGAGRASIKIDGSREWCTLAPPAVSRQSVNQSSAPLNYINQARKVIQNRKPNGFFRRQQGVGRGPCMEFRDDSFRAKSNYGW